MAASSSSSSTTPNNKNNRPSNASASPFNRIKSLLLNIKSIWVCGHVAAVLCSLNYAFSGSSSSYYGALKGAILAYGIVTYSSLGKNVSFDSSLLKRLMTDASFQYFVLAVYGWINSYPMGGILVTYSIFSSFHVLGYIKDTMIPTIFPSNQSPPPFATKIIEIIKGLVSNFQPSVLQAVAYWEILSVMPLLIFQVFRGNQSLFAPFLFAQFLRMRYNLSSTYKQAFGHIRQLIESKLTPYQNQSGIMGKVFKVWVKIRDMLIKYSQVQGTSPPSSRPNNTSGPAASGSTAQS